MNIKCIIDTVSYKSKPQNGGAVTNRMTLDTAKEYSIEEIKDSILKGKTIRPSYCGSREEQWKSQQMFMIDIDNEANLSDDIILNDYVKLVEGKKNKVRFLVGSEQHRSYNDIINYCKEINLIPNFVYTSFNHKEEQHKMRLVYVLDNVITDKDTAKRIQLYLMDCIGDIDIQCKNLNRFYYAGKEIVFDSGNILDSNNIIELSKDISIVSTPSKANKDNGSEKCPPNNKEIYNNSYIIRGTKTPKPDNTDIKDDNYTIKAISNRDIEYLKNKYGSGEKKIFNNNQEFVDYIRKEINLGELLEFKYPKSIRCIFHEDNNNSASIFQADDGAWIYKCFGCGVTYNILGVIEVLGKFRSRPKAYRFIREIFNLEIQETEWQKEQKEILLENMKVLNNGELEQNCPQTFKNIKSNLKYINQLLLIAMDNVTTERMIDNDNNVLFFASNKFIAKQLGMKEDNSKEISKKTTLLAYHKLLNKVDNSEVPEDLLKRSQAISINSPDDKNKKYRHVNYYSIPSYNNMLFPEIEQQGQAWKENNYTIKGLSREMFFRKEGQKTADWLYPQYKQVYDKQQETIVDRTTTYRSDKRTEIIVHIILWYFDEINYCLEKDIVCEIVLDQELRIKRSEAERQLKKSLPEILDAYGLSRIRANKQIKEKLGIVSNGYPFIIVKNDTLETL
ncbi:hypothetical protein Dred_2131 [Desulforamulus reducens MI-1]|uniref:Zinc finger CHC2-type domain-containing protein n=1 Tax=Desulforamulus reducens (strain ATCC BAA-1160 / DSM 100696 / MI-1) TaxID=349161 RepID=A4J6E5_DESRM|nr:hypothetical protein [Desulforamulus reducens]ABO50648.1 hypothetical protein Dred_2131 [Desulforamulus reducens MI-1]